MLRRNKSGASSAFFDRYQDALCATVARQRAGCSRTLQAFKISPMKQRLSSHRPVTRARLFAREILLASAITMAALMVFLASQEQTEMASAPPAETGSTQEAR
jgi:hypothetical protein